MDTIRELREMGAEITSMVTNGDGILSVEFTINGAHIKAQGDIDHRGLYAIQLPNIDHLKRLTECAR